MKINKLIGIGLFLSTFLVDAYVVSKLLENRKIQRQLSETHELLKEQEDRIKERLKPFRVSADDMDAE